MTPGQGQGRGFDTTSRVLASGYPGVEAGEVSGLDTHLLNDVNVYSYRVDHFVICFESEDYMLEDYHLA